MDDLEHEPKHPLPKAARYPLFILGLFILVVGELVAYSAGAGLGAEAAIAVVAYAFLLLSVALR